MRAQGTSMPCDGGAAAHGAQQEESRNRGLARLRDLVVTLVRRDLKVRYEGSTIGVAWSLAPPLLLLVVFHFLFQTVLELDIPRYSSFAFTGILVWTWTQAALLQSAGAITGSRELVRRPGFPLAVLPVVSVSTALVHFALAFPIMCLFLLLEGRELGVSLLCVPLLMLLQFGLLLGFGYLLAASHVFFRDTPHLLGVALQLGLFLSPVFYDSRAVPEAYRTLYALNPMVPLIEAYRAVLLDGRLPDGPGLLVLVLLASAALVIGLRTFLRVAHRFVEEL